MNDKVSKQASWQVEHSNLNGLDDIKEQASEQVSEPVSDQYKKEILKRNIKNNLYISKDIYVNVGWLSNRKVKFIKLIQTTFT